MDHTRLCTGAQEAWAPLSCLLTHSAPTQLSTLALCSVVTPVTTENSLPILWQRYKTEIETQ